MTTRLLVRNVILAALVTGTVYLVFLGHRKDYIGHYSAGMGATLLLLCAFLLWRGRVDGAPAVLITLVAICLGYVTENSIFRFAFFDPVDFCNQSAGACVACACVIGVPPRRADLLPVGVIALVLVAGGFIFAFT